MKSKTAGVVKWIRDTNRPAGWKNEPTPWAIFKGAGDRRAEGTAGRGVHRLWPCIRLFLRHPCRRGGYQSGIQQADCGQRPAPVPAGRITGNGGGAQNPGTDAVICGNSQMREIEPTSFPFLVSKFMVERTHKKTEVRSVKSSLANKIHVPANNPFPLATFHEGSFPKKKGPKSAKTR